MASKRVYQSRSASAAPYADPATSLSCAWRLRSSTSAATRPSPGSALPRPPGAGAVYRGSHSKTGLLGRFSWSLWVHWLGLQGETQAVRFWRCVLKPALCVCEHFGRDENRRVNKGSQVQGVTGPGIYRYGARTTFDHDRGTVGRPAARRYQAVNADLANPAAKSLQQACSKVRAHRPGELFSVEAGRQDKRLGGPDLDRQVPGGRHPVQHHDEQGPSRGGSRPCAPVYGSGRPTDAGMLVVAAQPGAPAPTGRHGRWLPRLRSGARYPPIAIIPAGRPDQAAAPNNGPMALSTSNYRSVRPSA